MITPEIKELVCFDYAEKVISGEIVAGELIILACKRFMNDLEREDLEFRYEIGDKFMKFASAMSLFEGSSEVLGTPINEALSPWQIFFIYNVLCFYRKESGKRRYTKVLLNIARKQAKTMVSSLLALWLLLADNEGAPMIALSANVREQAKEDLKFCSAFAKQLDPKGKTLKFYSNEIKTPFNNGRLAVFSSDSRNADGYNVSCFIVDEMGGATDTAMVDVWRSGQASRKNPLGIIISSAGFNLSGPFKKMIDVGKEVLRGIKEDDSYFYLIYTMDDGDDWEDPKNWIKSMPNLGVSVQEDFVREEIQNAKNNSDLEVSVLTKTFNKFVSSQKTWISQDFIQKATRDISWDEFDENTQVYLGIDLASTSDLTCVSFLFCKDEDDTLYFKNLYYLPDYTIEHSPNRSLYKNWRREGYLKASVGNVTDYDLILTDIMKLTQDVCLMKVGFDQWNSSQFNINATNEGLPMYPVSQSITNLTKPTKTLERLIKMGKVVIDNNPINRYCFENSMIKADWNENIKVIKGGKNEKIDGVVAMIMSLSCWLDFPSISASCFAI